MFSQQSPASSPSKQDVHVISVSIVFIHFSTLIQVEIEEQLKGGWVVCWREQKHKRVVWLNHTAKWDPPGMFLWWCGIAYSKWKDSGVLSHQYISISSDRGTDTAAAAAALRRPQMIEKKCIVPLQRWAVGSTSVGAGTTQTLQWLWHQKGLQRHKPSSNLFTHRRLKRPKPFWW